MEIGQWSWREIFIEIVNLFSLFRYHLPLKKDGDHHLNRLISLTPKDALRKVWPNGSLVEFFLYYWKKAGTFIKVESPSHNEALRKVWLKLVQWFCRFCQCIFVILLLHVSPLGTRVKLAQH